MYNSTITNIVEDEEEEEGKMRSENINPSTDNTTHTYILKERRMNE